MNRLKLPLLFLLAAAGCLVAAQTNSPAKKTEQTIEIDADSGCYDGIANQMVYVGHVFVTNNVNTGLHCERLTVDLPAGGGNPTNIVAETNVVVDVIDQKGETNHVTADKAIYSYLLVTNHPLGLTLDSSVSRPDTVVTNETVYFTGGNPMPRLESAHATVLAEPLILDMARKKFEMPGRLKMIFRQTSGSTNDPSFNLLK